ncbi:gel scht [Duganella sp. CY15W]|uniref:gel scht n=1 Tax=Duganella sp. CY15W TaxID=2692172 RepID=UPI00136C9758|nr:gel scht [Duganella sp. CY15W]MYM29955.1 gel scht [Duganella sp. CY15W]
MKTILAGIAASLALTSLSVAHAADYSVQVKSPQRYHLVEQDFYNFKNTYQLTNGQKIAFSARMDHYYAQLDNGERIRIYPVSRTAFVTDSGARFEFLDQGETVGIASFEKLPLAGNLPANTMVMAHR